MTNYKVHLNERNGFDDSIPQGFVKTVYDSFAEIAFSNRAKKLEKEFSEKTPDGSGLPEEITFVVERGKDDSYVAALYDDGSVSLNADALDGKSRESVMSSISHELVHIKQHDKVNSKKRKKGEYGKNDAVNSGLIDDSQPKKYLWLMENLQEDEIEAKLSQVYYYVKSTKIPKNEKSASETVEKVMKSVEDITHISQIKQTMDTVKKFLSGNNLWYINSFISDASAILYGKPSKGTKELEKSKKVSNKLIVIFEKKMKRLEKRLYNTIFQALTDKNNKESVNEDVENWIRKNTGYQKIYHDNTAFVEGDKVFIYFEGTVNGKRSCGECWRTVSSYDGNTLKFSDNLQPSEMSYKSQYIKTCDAWERAYNNLSYAIGDEKTIKDIKLNSKLSYERLNGVLCIVITSYAYTVKYYFRHVDGSFVKKDTPSMLWTSKFAGKRGFPEAVKVSCLKYDPNLYVIIPDRFQNEFVIRNSQDIFYAWNYKHKEEILKFCPWLKGMKAPWATDDTNRKYLIPRIRK